MTGVSTAEVKPLEPDATVADSTVSPEPTGRPILRLDDVSASYGDRPVIEESPLISTLANGWR